MDVRGQRKVHEYFSQMAIQREQALFPGAVEMMILAILKPQGLHGYAIAYEIQRRSNNLLLIQGGTIYQAARRLSKEKLISAEWVRSSRNRRICIYKITAAGAEHLDREVLRFEKMLKGMTHVLASAATLPSQTHFVSMFEFSLHHSLETK